MARLLRGGYARAMAKRPKSTIPRYRRRRQRSFGRRLLGWIVKLILIFLIGSVLWVLAYRFVNPPITATMLGDLLAGRGAKRDWMSIEKIDRDMVRAAIGAEDSKFCSHNGFDVQAIESAMIRNASGGRIRGGSTISLAAGSLSMGTTALWAKAPMAKTVQAATAASVLMSRFIAFSPLETRYAERPTSHHLLN